MRTRSKRVRTRRNPRKRSKRVRSRRRSRKVRSRKSKQVKILRGGAESDDEKDKSKILKTSRMFKEPDMKKLIGLVHPVDNFQPVEIQTTSGGRNIVQIKVHRLIKTRIINDSKIVGKGAVIKTLDGRKSGSLGIDTEVELLKNRPDGFSEIIVTGWVNQAEEGASSGNLYLDDETTKKLLERKRNSE